MLKPFLSYVCVVLVALTILAPASAQDQHTLKVAAYNIENAFDVYDDPYTKDEGTDVKLRWEYEAIAGALKAIDADVVGFEEVENEAVLRALVDEYLPDMGYKYVAVPLTNDERGIKVGIVSRLPIISVTSYRWQTLSLPDEKQTWHFARDLFHARLQLPDGKVLNAFVVHLKSKGSRDGDPQSVKWRSSEALRIRQIIEQMLASNPQELVVLMGDFNSQPGEPAINTLLEPAADGSAMLSDAHYLIPMPDRTTYPSERFPNSVIDFIMTSPALSARLIPESSKVFNDPALTKGSDHYPVEAEFDLSK